jgi:2'-5' RNA ligase
VTLVSGGRLFLGISLPQSTTNALKSHLKSRLGALQIPGRVVPPDNWHFTLRFLGNINAEAASDICLQLGHAPLGEPFHINIEGVGAFPSLHRAKALWLRVHEGQEPLVALSETVNDRLHQTGIEPGEHPFKPHLTLRRFKRSEDMRYVAEKIGDFSHAMAVNEVCLYQSHMGHGPPRYEILRRFSLST